MAVNSNVRSGWEIEQLLRLRERRPDLFEIAVQHLVKENEEIRWSLVVGAYQDRQINLGKAAELLNQTESEFQQTFVKLGIPLRIGAADLDEARAEVEAIRSWFAGETDGERS